MKSIRLPLMILLLGTAGTATSGVALADPNNPTDTDRAAARPFAIDGLEKVRAGNCREAVAPLEKAEALVHAPTTAVPLAQCQIQLGHIVAGTEILQRVVNEQLAPNAPPAFVEAKREARGILDAATPRIAKLKIHVDMGGGAVPPNLEVLVDNQRVPLVLLDNDRPTDPGQHHVVVRQPGGSSAEMDVSLAEGQTTSVSLRLSAAAGGAVTGGVPDPYGQGVVTPPPPPGGVQPGAVGATPPPDAGVPGAPWNAFEFGVRFAYGVPFGNLMGGNGNDLNKTVSGQFAPLWLDAGVRVASHWYVGGYFAYGIGQPSNQLFGGECSQTGVGCSANDIRLGIDAAYHILPDGKVDPWLGLGFGYEWGSVSGTVDAAHSTTGSAITNNLGADGWEFFNVQGGVDFRLLDGALGIGPFILLSVDQYSHQSSPTDNNGGTTGGPIQSQSIHEWVLFGAKGTYDVKLQ